MAQEYTQWEPLQSQWLGPHGGGFLCADAQIAIELDGGEHVDNPDEDRCVWCDPFADNRVQDFISAA